MVTQRFMECYYWIAYVWFAVLFVVMAVPAAAEIRKLFASGRK